MTEIGFLWKEQILFPQMCWGLDGDELLVCTTIRDEDTLSKEEVMEALQEVVRPKIKWELERDASYQGWELYGRIPLGISIR